MKRSYFFAFFIVALGAALIVGLRSPPKMPDAPRSKPVAAVDSPPIAPRAAATSPRSVPTSVPVPPLAAIEDAGALTAKLHAMQIRSYDDMALSLAEGRAKLKLSDLDHRRLLDDVEDFQKAVAMIDQLFVRVISFDGEKLVLEIPPHVEQSAPVKAAFVAQIRRDFPPELADRIVGALEVNLATLFDGFGQFSHTYTVLNPRADGQVNVVKVAKIPAETEPNSFLVREASDLSGSGWFDRGILDMAHQVIVATFEAYFPADPTVPLPPHVP